MWHVFYSERCRSNFYQAMLLKYQMMILTVPIALSEKINYQMSYLIFHKFSKIELNDLMRDLYLSKDKSELVGIKNE